jgi:hypothetical protein
MRRQGKEHPWRCLVTIAWLPSLQWQVHTGGIVKCDSEELSVAHLTAYRSAWKAWNSEQRQNAYQLAIAIPIMNKSES